MTEKSRESWREQVELVAIEMGYGHLRPAHSLGTFLGNQEVLLADQAPLASLHEQKKWVQLRKAYEMLSRAGSVPVLGTLMGEVLQGVTKIPSLYPRRDLSKPTLEVRLLEMSAQRGLGMDLSARLQRENRALLTTFYAPAVLSDYHGSESLFCVVTDADVHRIWAPIAPHHTNITYLAPSSRVRRRLKAYGVPADKVIVTGFPLPHELVGGPTGEILRRNLRRRLVALDPKRRFLREIHDEVAHFLGELPEVADAPPHLVFAVGGAGAQSDMVFSFLPGLAKRIRRKKLRLTLVAGLRPEVARQFTSAIEKAQLLPELEDGSVSILLCSTHREYFESFNELLSRADLLWTKPSELSFYGALGLPLIFSDPVGHHERYNRRWAIDSGVGNKQYDPKHAGEWLWEMLKDGTFAGAAWSGYMRMPKFGLYRIVQEVLGPAALEKLLAESSSDSSSTVEHLKIVSRVTAPSENGFSSFPSVS